MNRRQAIEAMFQGHYVRPIEPLYVNHKRTPAFRWNDSTQAIECCWAPDVAPDEWKRARNSFYLASEYRLEVPQ